jgi:DNA adenine methylase
MLANDPNGISEVANDVNNHLSLFWQVLADVKDFAEMQRILEATPFCQCDWARAEFDWWGGESRADKAARFFIRCRQSMSGRMKCFAPLTRNRTRSGMNEQVSAWLSAIDGLPEVHQRLRRVAILNQDAVDVIRQQDGPRTLFYLDPPYLHETRSTTGEYQHEMSDEDHRRLLTVLAEIEGDFVLSGYPSKLYEEFQKDCGWRTDVKMIDNKSSKAASKETKPETIWMNF